jgi:hypothetical protein
LKEEVLHRIVLRRVSAVDVSTIEDKVNARKEVAMRKIVAGLFISLDSVLHLTYRPVGV